MLRLFPTFRNVEQHSIVQFTTEGKRDTPCVFLQKKWVTRFGCTDALGQPPVSLSPVLLLSLLLLS